MVCMSTILRRPDATTKMHTMNVRARATYARLALDSLVLQKINV